MGAVAGKKKRKGLTGKGEHPASPQLMSKRRAKLEAARIARRAILARTRAAQAEIDRYIRGVRGGRLPVIVKGEPRKRDDAEPRYTPEEEAERERPPMAPPVPYAINEGTQAAAKQPRSSDSGFSCCSLCGEPGHNRRRHRFIDAIKVAAKARRDGLSFDDVRSMLRTAAAASDSAR